MTAVIIKNKKQDSLGWGKGILISVLVLASSCASTKPTTSVSSPEVAEEIREHMRQYVDIFNNEQAGQIAKEIYLAPVLTSESAEQKLYADLTEKDVREDFDDAFVAMKGNGWNRSVIHGIAVHPKGKDLAFIDMEFSRFKANGETIPPAPKSWSYVLAKIEAGWRIISAHEQSAQAPPSPSQMMNEVKAHMTRYLGLFNDGQAERIAKEIYLAPMQMRKFGDETHVVASTTEEIHTQFNAMFETIKSKGWARSKLHGMDIRLGGNDLAFVDMRFSRLKNNGQPIPPAQRIASYVLVKRPNGWRIVSVLGQSPPTE
ncbi:MAG: hypothetical protein H8E20_11775 [Verrucomicrobia bacterium]|nr:hypothetical protein [Verrucomicrobiota bacterium]